MQTFPYWQTAIAQEQGWDEQKNRKIADFLVWNGFSGAAPESAEEITAIENLEVAGEQLILLLRSISYIYSDRLDLEPACEKVLQENLPDLPPEDSSEKIAWVERLFLKGLQKLRQGNRTDAAKIWLMAQPHCSTRHQEVLEARDQLMRGVFHMNLGRYRMATELIESQLAEFESDVDLFVLIHAYAALIIAYGRVGQFDQAHAELDRMSEALKGKPPAIMVRLYRLRVLTLMMKGEFSHAYEILTSMLADDASKGLIRAYLLQQLLGYQINRNEMDRARETLAQLEAYVESLGLSRDVINLYKERAELEIRTGSPKQALDGLETALEQARAGQDFQDEFVFGLLRAQALAYTGKPEQALEALESTLRLGEENSYLSGLVLAYFHAAGIAFQAGAAAKFRTFAGRGQALAEELGMDVRAACFEYMQQMQVGRKPRAFALLSLLNHPNFGGDVDYYLESYGVVTGQVVRLQDEEGIQSEVSEPEMRRMLRHARGVYVFTDEALLVVHDSSGPQVTQLKRESVVTEAILYLFQRSARAASVEEIFALQHQAKFNPSRHASQVKMLIHRMRGVLESFKILVRHSRITKKYQIESPLPVFLVDWAGRQ